MMHNPRCLKLLATALAFCTAGTSVVAGFEPRDTRAVKMDQGLIAHWTFDVDAGDVSGNGHDGVLVGGSIGTGLIGPGSLDLRGSQGYVRVASPVLNQLPECSMSFWVNFQSLVVPEGECCLAMFAEDQFLIGALHNNAAGGTEIEWSVADGGEARVAAPAEGPPTGWVHYAWIYDNGALDVFVNGEQVLDSDVDPNPVAVGSGMAATIGAWNQDGQGDFVRFLDARIDDLRFYDRALTGDEVIALSQMAAEQVARGAWANRDTLGQGHLLDPLRQTGLVFGAWFTFDDATVKLGSADNRWFTYLLTVQGATLSGDITQTSGGLFDQGGESDNVDVGDVSVRLSNCLGAEFSYAFDDGPSGSFTLEPLTAILGLPGSTCD